MATSPKRIETLVGFFLFVGLTLLGILIMQFGRFADRFQGVYTVTVSFSDASGLIKGSQVRLSGATPNGRRELAPEVPILPSEICGGGGQQDQRPRHGPRAVRPDQEGALHVLFGGMESRRQLRPLGRLPRSGKPEPQILGVALPPGEAVAGPT